MEDTELDEKSLKKKEDKSKINKLKYHSIFLFIATILLTIYSGNFIYSIFSEGAGFLSFVSIFFLVVSSIVSFVMTIFKNFEYNLTYIQYKVDYEGYVRKGKLI